jgi:hypothetical protein
MIKGLAICIGGIFIGAVGMEIIQKKYPKAMNKLYKKADKIITGTKKGYKQAKDAFKAGYESSTKTRKAAPTGA